MDESARLLRREEEERKPRQAQAFMDAGDVGVMEERAERMQALEVSTKLSGRTLNVFLTHQGGIVPCGGCVWWVWSCGHMCTCMFARYMGGSEDYVQLSEGSSPL